MVRPHDKGGAMPYGVNPVTGRPGPTPKPSRDGDKIQARQRVNVEVRTGRRPHPNSLPCSLCGHVHRLGGARHEYHHHLGYAPENHLKVVPVCSRCHANTEGTRSDRARCEHGHEYTPENTGTKPNGTRFCRECRRIHDRGRRNAAFWREYRLRKKEGICYGS